MRWPMLAGGKDDGRAIVACARISSICAVVRSSTICMSWLVLSRTLLSFKVRLDYSTSSLAWLTYHRFGLRAGRLDVTLRAERHPGRENPLFRQLNAAAPC